MPQTIILPSSNTIITTDDNDKIELTFDSGEVNCITFALSTLENITWWKGIKIFGDGS